MFQSAFAPFIPDDEFADVARQLEEILSELNQVIDPILRCSLLASTRLLMAEADRLAGLESAAKEGPNHRANDNC